MNSSVRCFTLETTNTCFKFGDNNRCGMCENLGVKKKGKIKLCEIYYIN